jgi:hypothetical protein
MSISDELYTRVFGKLRALHPEPHVKRVATWVWVVVGLILSHSVHLSQIAQHLPSAAQAAGRIALDNANVREDPRVDFKIVGALLNRQSAAGLRRAPKLPGYTSRSPPGKAAKAGSRPPA